MNQPDKIPSDALFIRWGKFQAGAFGRPAIIALALLAAAVIASRLIGVF